MMVDTKDRWVEIGKSPNRYIMPLSEAFDFVKLAHSRGKMTDSQKEVRIDELIDVSFIMDWGD